MSSTTLYSQKASSLIVIEGNSKFVLYAIDKFFVEVIWDNEKDEIIGKGVFKEGNSMDKYSNVPKEV
ncbi:hypothetical protein [uncultured Eudoraea sp.]|jgi:hypothetical protein|uniref:hypothetical protein n=1 Tax=uncultured Eudoraea sp. TaxID=1035614 RepID=UPI00260F9F41|nr:hypothetical protein [uncultured Eudoraea sp.]